ncbi:MAG: twin-arginine translocation pathway signal protein [SAR324 cluster bacterium]|uniref:Twin-arginine translocation pathway signal protein n=1 Tax=SAR324 cluster bacterium TaxID=2024889 RepID=A0A2A4TAF1_9DELT|nr:MAG: twin-arginine translocation pathway signal protein [SAR324 cluster bacterium]
MAEKPTLRIGHLKITDHLILGITQDRITKGKESFEHFNLQSQPYMGWNQISDALKAGEVDACCLLAPTAMDLYKAGVGIKLILFAHKTGSVLIKNKLANIETIADLKGKMVAIPYQLSVHHMLLHKLLREHGLEPGAGKDVGLEVMAPSQMPQAIEYDDEGEVGGFIVAEPFGSQAILEGYGEEFYLSKDLWPKHPCCVVVARDEILEKYPDAIQELTNSFVNSGNFVQDHLEETIEIAVNFLGQSKQIITNVLTQPADRVLTSELFPVIDDLAIIQDYMCDEMKILKGKIDLDKFVDTRFAKEAGAK